MLPAVHKDTAQSYEGLADTYFLKRNYEKAIANYQKSLKIRE